VPEPEKLRIPIRGSTGQPGWDGILVTPIGYKEFVPEGKSFWEIGTGNNPKAKATGDFKKRTKAVSEAEQSNSTFVFVTSRSSYHTWGEKDQGAWIEACKAQSKWKDVRVIDANVLEHWLEHFPAIDLWLANEFGIPVAGLNIPVMHWNTLRAYGDPPPLKAEVFLKFREPALEKLKALLNGEIQVLMIETRYEEEVADYVAAALDYLEENEHVDYSGRCLFIETADTWRSMCELPTRHILVAKPQLDVATNHELQVLAKSKGHAVLYPSMPYSGRHPSSVLLREHTAHELQQSLEECGYLPEQARQIAAQSNGRITILKRLLVHASAAPHWADRSEAGELGRFALIGSFIDESKDVAPVSAILGKDLGEWTFKMRPLSLVVDPPLIQHSGRWKFVSRYEGWTWLGKHLIDADLRRFSEQALIVLREVDKRFNIDKEERSFLVTTKDDEKFSRLLRQGISEGLALLGSHDQVLQSCSPNAGPSTSAHVVRELLSDSDWKLWCSLNDVMPLLAEAAPNEFLDAIEDHLKVDNGALFKSIFDQETTGFFGSTYMTGLLWALETLAWHSAYLTRTTLALGKLAALDPGSNWANRPSNSLTTIFLPWLPQTLASIEQRVNAVSALCNKDEDVGWKLLLSLLPHQSTTSSGSHKPVWRALILENHQRNVTYEDYWNQVKRYSGLAVHIAKKDQCRSVELIDKLDQLVPDVISEFLTYLESVEFRNMDDEQRLPIWERLFALSMESKRFPDRESLLSMADLTRVTNLVKLLQPAKSSMRNRRLFGEREYEVIEERGGRFAEQQKQLDIRRQAASAEILKQEGIAGVVEFARSVHHSGQVGVALGNLPDFDLDTSLLPTYLNHEDMALQHFIGGYAWAKYWRLGLPWLDTLNISSWSFEQAANFFARLPFNKGIWSRAEAMLGEYGPIYWRSLGNINPFHAGEDILEATRLLLKYERPRLAADCLGHARHTKQSIPADLIAEVLIANLRSVEPIGSMLQHELTELISLLQEHPAKDVGQLRSIELAYLPILEYGYSGSPLFLDRALAEDPRFFCEVIALVYKPEVPEGIENISPTESERHLAERAFRLLYRWKLSPGAQPDGKFDDEAFNLWLEGVKTVTAQSGYRKAALRQVGQVVAHLPVYKEGIGIPGAVARFLEDEEEDFVRRSYTNGLYNKRGTHGVTGGLGERNLANRYAEWAMRVEGAGFVRLAKTLRDLSKTYEHEAKEEEARAVLEKEGMR
jgi:hypothetical protein